MTPIVTVFADSPDRGRGLARDMRVRWALEEVGQSYEVRPLSFEALKESDHLTRQPFGQIPVYECGDFVLFESGAIVLHVAERGEGLIPKEPHARARAIVWLFAALNTVEPTIVEREQVSHSERDQPWFSERLPLLEERIRHRLRPLARHLKHTDWLDGAFSVGDLMMITVLQRAKGMGVLDAFPEILSYVARGEARPAYRRAFDSQLALACKARVNATADGRGR